MTFWTALILGLVASGHCVSMCAGLQTAIQTTSNNQQYAMRNAKQYIVHVLVLNLGRVTTYAIAGLIFSLLGAATLRSLNIPLISSWLRILSGIIIFLIGVQILFCQHRPFQFIEPLGSIFWQYASKLINNSKSSLITSFTNGLAWGFLPCGLVYGVLFSTVFINEPLDAVLVMTGFGFGTIPALTFTGSLYQEFRSIMHKGSLQRLTGWMFIVGSVAIVTSPYWVNKSFLKDYPILLNSVFCFS